MSEGLLLPFQFPFMLNAFWICAIVAVPTALLSCFLVLKGWALMGDAISHAVLPGIVLAYITGVPLILGAFGAGMICALLTGFLASNSRVKQDTVMGVVFSGMFGIGIILYTSIESGAHLDHILFGNLLGVGPEDLRIPKLLSRLRDEGIAEVILALNATVDGQTTAHYIADALEGAGVRVTSLAQGVPVGGELDYLDDGTIQAALRARKSV